MIANEWLFNSPWVGETEIWNTFLMIIGFKLIAVANHSSLSLKDKRKG